MYNIDRYLASITITMHVLLCMFYDWNMCVIKFSILFFFYYGKERKYIDFVFSIDIQYIFKHIFMYIFWIIMVKHLFKNAKQQPYKQYKLGTYIYIYSTQCINI